MSDDTPTQRFDSPVDAPTGLIAAPADEVVAEGRSRRLIIILSIVGGVLLLGVVILLVVLLTRGSSAPVALPTNSPSPSVSATASATPTKSASPTPTPTVTSTATQAPPPPPPPNTATTVTSFDMAKSHNCSQGTPVYLQVSWTSENGVAAYFGVNTADAQTGGMGWTLPPSGNQDDFPNGYVPYEYQCGNTTTDYTITIVGSDGTKASKKITVKAEN